ncbi:MAG: tRNA(Glu)-specific nuclease WapA precursor [Lentisphaerae bacterium ADurb.BinA184]|nr:MAG: tRNA(Glu)-specific nuclease WapA precursor [Lentisphaerae bacterium ADurb.BinA184]
MTTVFAGTLAHAGLQPGSVSLTAGGRTFTDDGRGHLVGTAGTEGTLDYATGEWTLDFGAAALPDGVAVAADYVYVVVTGGGPAGPALDRWYLHGLEVDQVLAQEDAAGAVYWHLADREGSVRDLLDGAGALADHTLMTAFGQVVSRTAPAIANRYYFTGRELDAETGLYYYRARYYDPATHRFISADPVGLASGDTNLYRYVGNNPANATDPQGTSAAGVGRDWLAEEAQSRKSRHDYAAIFKPLYEVNLRISQGIYDITKSAFHAVGWNREGIEVSWVGASLIGAVEGTFNLQEHRLNLYKFGRGLVRGTLALAKDLVLATLYDTAMVVGSTLYDAVTHGGEAVFKWLSESDDVTAWFGSVFQEEYAANWKGKATNKLGEYRPVSSMWQMADACAAKSTNTLGFVGNFAAAMGWGIFEGLAHGVGAILSGDPERAGEATPGFVMALDAVYGALKPIARVQNLGQGVRSLGGALLKPFRTIAETVSRARGTARAAGGGWQGAAVSLGMEWRWFNEGITPLEQALEALSGKQITGPRGAAPKAPQGVGWRRLTFASGDLMRQVRNDGYASRAYARIKALYEEPILQAAELDQLARGTQPGALQAHSGGGSGMTFTLDLARAAGKDVYKILVDQFTNVEKVGDGVMNIWVKADLDAIDALGIANTEGFGTFFNQKMIAESAWWSFEEILGHESVHAADAINPRLKDIYNAYETDPIAQAMIEMRAEMLNPMGQFKYRTAAAAFDYFTGYGSYKFTDAAGKVRYTANFLEKELGRAAPARGVEALPLDRLVADADLLDKGVFRETYRQALQASRQPGALAKVGSFVNNKVTALYGQVRNFVARQWARWRPQPARPSAVETPATRLSNRVSPNMSTVRALQRARQVKSAEYAEAAARQRQRLAQAAQESWAVEAQARTVASLEKALGQKTAKPKASAPFQAAMTPEEAMALARRKVGGREYSDPFRQTLAKQRRQHKWSEPAKPFVADPANPAVKAGKSPIAVEAWWRAERWDPNKAWYTGLPQEVQTFYQLWREFGETFMADELSQTLMNKFGLPDPRSRALTTRLFYEVLLEKDFLANKAGKDVSRFVVAKVVNEVRRIYGLERIPTEQFYAMKRPPASSLGYSMGIQVAQAIERRIPQYVESWANHYGVTFEEMALSLQNDAYFYTDLVRQVYDDMGYANPSGSGVPLGIHPEALWQGVMKRMQLPKDWKPIPAQQPTATTPQVRDAATPFGPAFLADSAADGTPPGASPDAPETTTPATSADAEDDDAGADAPAEAGDVTRQDGSPVGFVPLAEAMAEDAVAPPTGLQNADFAISDPQSPDFGWRVFGEAAVVGGAATLSEGGLLFSDLSQTFRLPPGKSRLLFTISGIALAGRGAGELPDAIEVAVLRTADGASPLGSVAGLDRTDAIVSIQADGRIRFAPGVEVTVGRAAVASGDVVPLDGPIEIALPVHQIADGTLVTLLFDLVSLGDGGSQATVSGLSFTNRDTVTLDLRPGWNAVSVPFTPYENGVEEVFAGVPLAGPVWKMVDGKYERATTIEAQTGYWVCLTGDQAVPLALSGEERRDGTVAIRDGWNLVGPLADVAPPSTRDLLGRVFYWDADWQTQMPVADGELLERSRAYWFYADEAQTLDLGPRGGRGDAVAMVTATPASVAETRTTAREAADGSGVVASLSTAVGTDLPDRTDLSDLSEPTAAAISPAPCFLTGCGCTGDAFDPLASLRTVRQFTLENDDRLALAPGR